MLLWATRSNYPSQEHESCTGRVRLVAQLGSVSRFGKIAALIMLTAMRRAATGDLARVMALRERA